MYLPAVFSTRRPRWLAASAAVLAMTAVGIVPALTSPSQAAAAGAAVNVTVNANENLGAIPGTAYGLNQAVWDGQMNSPTSVSLLSHANIGLMRYPGGSYGDIY